MNKYSIFAPAVILLTLAGCKNPAQENADAGQVEEAVQEASISDVSVEAAQSIISENEIVILDVRTPEEFEAGHIANATNVNFKSADFAENLSKLDRNAHYVLHCKSGGRSSKALEVMKEQGFQKISHMNNGFDAWAASELPVEVGQ